MRRRPRTEGRFESDHAVTAIAAWTRVDRAQLAVGTRLALEGASIAAQVRDSARPAHVDSFVGATGPIAREAQALGIRASIGCPITVDGRLWGVVAASKTRDEAFPPDMEQRFPAEIEASAYFVVAEALTNMAKHSNAQHANVAAALENGTLRIDVCDDGVGGARPDASGLLGLRDRVVTLGGELEVHSPPGGGTRITVTLPSGHERSRELCDDGSYDTPGSSRDESAPSHP